MLVLYCPSHLHFFRLDFSAAAGEANKSTARGHSKTFYAPAGVENIVDAAVHIKLKILQVFSFLGMLDVCHELVGQALNVHSQRLKVEFEIEAFRNHPLGECRYNSPSTRGIMIQNMVQEVDSLLHPGATPVEHTSYNSPIDWRRSGLRVECKHGRIVCGRNFCRFS